MASKKHTTNLPRFRVERMGEGFAVVDTIDIKIHEFASRQAAELECAARNGTGRQKTSESSSHQQFRDKFRESGVTFEDIDADDQSRDRANARLRQPDHLRLLIARRTEQQAQQALSDYKNWLPPLLGDWADEIAQRLGYGGTKRRSWHAVDVIFALQIDGFDFTFTSPHIRELHFKVWPTFDGGPAPGFEERTVLAVHYLSPDPAPAKARYFGASERTYQRQVAAALQWLAARWVNDAPWLSEADEVSEDDDFDTHWGIDAYDRANLRWAK